MAQVISCKRRVARARDEFQFASVLLLFGQDESSWFAAPDGGSIRMGASSTGHHLCISFSSQCLSCHRRRHLHVFLDHLRPPDLPSSTLVVVSA